MSVTLQRHAKLDDVLLESAIGFDGQGKPEYDSGILIKARVALSGGGVGTTAAGARVIRLPSGQEVQIIATLWVNGDTVPLPQLDDRVTTAAGLMGIVVDRSEIRAVGGAVDHVRVRIREE